MVWSAEDGRNQLLAPSSPNLLFILPGVLATLSRHLSRNTSISCCSRGMHTCWQIEGLFSGSTRRESDYSLHLFPSFFWFHAARTAAEAANIGADDSIRPHDEFALTANISPIALNSLKHCPLKSMALYMTASMSLSVRTGNDCSGFLCASTSTLRIDAFYEAALISLAWPHWHAKLACRKSFKRIKMLPSLYISSRSFSCLINYSGPIR